MKETLTGLAEARALIEQVEAQAREANDARWGTWPDVEALTHDDWLLAAAVQVTAWSPAAVLALCEGWRETLDDAEAQAERHTAEFYEGSWWCTHTLSAWSAEPCPDAVRAERMVERVRAAAQRALGETQ